MRIRGVVLLLTVVCTSALALAQSASSPSTAEQRTRALAMIDDLEANPLGPSANQERNSLTSFLIQVPDVHVGMCSGLLGKLSKAGQDSNLLVMQPTFSSARYAIQHGGGNTGSLEQYMAGVLGTLTTYQNLLKVKPADKQPALDELLKKQSNGTLTAYVKMQMASTCKVKGT